MGVLLVLAVAVLSGTPAPDSSSASGEIGEPASAERGAGAAEFPLVVVTNRRPSRVLRGDYEPPAELIVAYEREWEASIAQLVHAAQGQADVRLLTHSGDIGRPLVVQLSKMVGVSVLESRFDTPWIRDFGPVEIYDTQRGTVWLDFDYSWERPQDDAFPAWLSGLVQTPLEATDFVLDGGAVASNGLGVCVITEINLRQGGFAPSASHELSPLLTRLGCWITAIVPSLPGEPTGHADLVAQFLGPDTVAVASVDSRHALVAKQLERVVEALMIAADLAALPLKVVRLPVQIESPVYYSYVNLTRLRTRLLVPGFDALPRSQETSAYRILHAALPGIDLVRIQSDAMARRAGGVHCVTLGLGRTRAPQKS